MKTLIFYFVLIALSFQSFGQEMVKVNIIAYYDQVPAPPPDVKAAYQRLTCVEENMSLQCSAEKFYQPIVSDLAGIKQQLEQLNIALAMPASSGMQNMNPEEIQKKMAAMTQEEQMQFAMEMSQQMMNAGMNNMPESDEVLAAIEEHGQLATQIATEFQNPSETSRKRTALARKRERKHQEVNTWFKAEFDKLPLVSFGEAGKGPDPKAEYTLKVASMEKHIAVENEYLQALQQLWPEYCAHLKTQYTPFQEKLAAINYGEDVLNQENKRILVGGQGLLPGPADDLVQFSRDVTETAANWWLQKMELERQKSQD